MFLHRPRKMQVMKKLNPPRLLLLFTVVIFACLILYRSFNSAQENSQSLLRKDQSNTDHPKLVELLRKASMPDRTVILTILDQAWARPGSILELFLESFKVGVGTKKLLNHLVIVTTDDQAFQYCKAMHPHCFPLPTPEDAVGRKPLMHPDRSKFDRRTIRILGEVDELGFNFVFTDADVMWLKNPFLYFDPVQELTIACEVYTGDPKSTSNVADRGFFFVKSNDISVEFLKYWELAMVLYPDHDAQSILEMIKEDEVIQFRLRVRIKYLDTVYFSGFCQPNKDIGQVHTMHANCCEDLESKVHDLRLVLDDWRNSTTGLSTPGSSWRVPSKCRKQQNNSLPKLNPCVFLARFVLQGRSIRTQEYVTFIDEKQNLKSIKI